MGNLVSPRARPQPGCPMRDHDRLPAPLRQWAIHAALPWSPRSLRRIWHRALREAGTPEAALARLTAAEAATLAREGLSPTGQRR